MAFKGTLMVGGRFLTPEQQRFELEVKFRCYVYKSYTPL